jgi:hypothetical protein
MPLSSALPQDIQTQSFAFAMDLGIVLRQLLQEVQDLRAENQRLIAKVEALEALHELYHGPIPAKKDWPDLKEALARQKDALSELPTRAFEQDHDIQLQEQGIDSIAKKEMKHSGKKTRRRIEKLKELLKGYGGSQTFEQLQIDLNLSPSQFSQLVRKLDKRIFEVAYLPGGKKGEKVLKLRAAIGEPFETK